MRVRNPNLLKYAILPNELEVVTKIRYKDSGTFSSITALENGEINVNFFKPVDGIAPGQSAVFYDGDDVVGGGFICRQ